MKPFLTIQEIEVLHEAHRASRTKRHADRIKTILCLHYGLGYKKIAQLLLLDDSTLRTYYSEYKDGGIDKLLEDNYGGKKGNLTKIQEKELAGHLDIQMYRRAKDVIDYVHNTYKITYSIEGMTHLLHRLGFVYKKTKQVPGKADEEKQKEFVSKYNKITKEIGQGDVVYFLDASHPQHNSMPAYGWIRKGTTKELKSNTGRKRINLHGALNLDKLEVVIREDETINYRSTIALYKQLEHKHTTGIIWVIEDNATYYKKKEVQEYLKTSRIKVIFLPAYSPNLNIIERLWKIMHEEILYNEYYASYLEFKTAVMGFFENISDYEDKLKTRLTHNFQLIPTWSSDSYMR
jgi:transposase